MQWKIYKMQTNRVKCTVNGTENFQFLRSLYFINRTTQFNLQSYMKPRLQGEGETCVFFNVLFTLRTLVSRENDCLSQGIFGLGKVVYHILNMRLGNTP